MPLWIALQEFWHDLRQQKLRAFLTILGITWGTVAVVVLLAFGFGFKKQTEKNMHGLGEAITIVFPGQTTKPYQGFGIGRWIRFHMEDADLLAREIPQIHTVCPEFARWNSTVRYRDKQIKPLVSGVPPEYAEIRNIFPQPGGRFINLLDERHRRHVIFLGDSLKYLLFGNKKAVGQYVSLDGVPFLVIGVMQHKNQNSSYNRRDEDRAFIPLSTFSTFYGEKIINNLVIKPKDPRLSPHITERLYQVLGRKYRFDPTDKNALFIWDTTEFDKIALYFFLGFNLFMAIVGSLTLIVGGIGVANIMYVVVQERMREIGIRRAVGAKRLHILAQFFLEAFAIVLAGSLLGFSIAWALTRLARLIPMERYMGYPEFSPTVVLIASLILGAVAFAAGFFPARRAARLDPVQCLRQ
jgi:putative ABC transport system permease protein